MSCCLPLVVSPKTQAQVSISMLLAAATDNPPPVASHNLSALQQTESFPKPSTVGSPKAKNGFNSFQVGLKHELWELTISTSSMWGEGGLYKKEFDTTPKYDKL